MLKEKPPLQTVKTIFFLLGNIGQENIFYNILAQKKAF